MDQFRFKANKVEVNVAKEELVVGTRDSRLALWQADWVIKGLKRFWPNLSFTVKTIKTRGDQNPDLPLTNFNDKGLFTKELEHQLLTGQIDLAVHSMKDLPTGIPGGLIIGAFGERENPGEVLISREGFDLDHLPRGATVGTGSLRRKAQLLNYRPDLKILDIRGNVETRLRKVEEGRYDAIVLAYAGIKRLGLEHRISQQLPMSICLPAMGQGCIGVEIRKDDSEVMKIVKVIDDFPTRAAVLAERTLLQDLEGGCQAPIGTYATVSGAIIRLEGLVASHDGRQIVRGCDEGPAQDPRTLGHRLAETLFGMGADAILREVREGGGKLE